MSDFVTGFATGLAVQFAGGKLVSLWNSKAKGIEDAISNAPDELAEKVGLQLPRGLDATWHNLVHFAVGHVSSLFGDARFWREVIRAVVTRNPAQAVLLMQEIQKINWTNTWNAIRSLLSPELKQIVNEVEEGMATKIIAAHVVTGNVIAPPAMESEGIKKVAVEAIRSVAPAMKMPEAPMSSSVVEKLILESQARQAKLSGDVRG